MNLEELGQFVEWKTETVKMLEMLLEKEETELVGLDRQLGSLEDERDQLGNGVGQSRLSPERNRVPGHRRCRAA